MAWNILGTVPRMCLMHDAPLISPENKDSAPELIARLPKVELDAVFAPESLPADNAALTAAMREYVQELAAANVVYAEIRFDPQHLLFGAEAALEAATAGLEYVQELAAANVVYAEIRFDPQHLLFGAEAALEA
ncbi:hypothetical protein HT105_21080, partial [Bacteroides fragilis]|nr:hypothetical protein [Bacteroides fragilis]